MGGLANPLLALDLQLGQPLPRRRDPRLEFRLLEQPVAVSIDQSRNHFFYIIDQLLDLLHLPARTRLLPLQPPLVLRADPLGLGQEMAHIFPDGRIQHIGADLLVPAQALAAESVGVRTGAAIVGVGDLAFALGRGPARRFAVAAVTIATGWSDQLSGRDLHPLKIRAFHGALLPGPPVVLRRSSIEGVRR